MAILIEVKKVIIGEKSNGSGKRPVSYETELIRADNIQNARRYQKNEKDVDPIDGDVTLLIMESLSSSQNGSRGVYKVHVNEPYLSLKHRLKNAGITISELA